MTTAQARLPEPAREPAAVLQQLRAAAGRGEVPSMLLFWGHTPLPDPAIGPWVLSQWWPAAFTVDGERFATAEHFMMASKAALFGDASTRRAILGTPDPNTAKALGRKVASYDDARWSAVRYELVVRGNLAKFGAHEALRDYLVSTGDRVLVEASPFDRVWGIGLGANHPRAHDPRTWKGENLLGFALMDVRARLRGA